MRMMIADYERNTKGLDQAKAFEALEGGRQFDPKGGDMSRYNEIIKRSEAKDRGQQYINNRPQNQGGSKPYGGNDTAIANTQTQTVTQDNDQTSSITGDNNYVYQQQDNSIRATEEQRSFVYNSNGEGPDTCNYGDPCWNC